MEKTNQTEAAPSEDKDFEAIKAKIPFDDGDKKKEEPKEEPKAPEPKVEPKEPVVDPKDQKTEEEEPLKPSRPEKYIPIKQYTSEKDQWKETLSEKDKRISELEAIANGKPDTQKNDKLIKSYMEKYDVDEDTAKAEIDRVRFVNDNGEEKPEPKKPETPTTPQLTDEQKAKIEMADQLNAEKQFDSEYENSAIPQLKTLFPNATPEQLKAAKVEMEALATTSEYLNQSLDYIAFKEKDTFADIFSSTRKGPETTRAPQKGKETFVPSDFDKGKTPFAELDALPEDERNKIIKGMSIKTWDAYSHYKNQQDELVIS